ncbi:MAG: Cof-type HAD-IIB family hydrolase [Ruminiclostridium sp.]
MYKLVAIDLDGTLLDMNKEISNRNKRAIALAIEKGTKIVICSGRVFSGARIYAKQVMSKDPIIACNGAIISENINKKIIYSNILSTEDCFKVVDICHKYEVYYHVYAGDTMLTEKLGFTSLKYSEKNKLLPPEDRVEIEVTENMSDELIKMQGRVFKIVVVNDNLELLKRVRDDMKQIESIDLMSSNYDNFEVVNKGVSKGAALKKISELLDIPAAEMIAIGDNENDISMLKYAGLGIAMDNGENCAKEAAKYITASNSQDGVAKAIEKFILEY